MEVAAVKTAIKPTVARDDAQLRKAPRRGLSQRLIAVAIAITLAAMVGCSSHSRNLGDDRVAPASPDSREAFTSNPQVAQILASSCFDCHSEQGAAAWYVKMAPSYWFSGSARENLNFTEWQEYDADRKNEAIAAIGRTVNRGEMPPWDYTVFHPAAELSNEQKDLVSEWAARHVEALPAH